MTPRNPPRLPPRLLPPCLAAAAAAAILAGLGGCYERVVRAKGLGADNYNVSEPYQESGKLDEWIFGSPGPRERTRNNTKLPK